MKLVTIKDQIRPTFDRPAQIRTSEADYAKCDVVDTLRDKLVVEIIEFRRNTPRIVRDRIPIKEIKSIRFFATSHH